MLTTLLSQLLGTPPRQGRQSVTTQYTISIDGHTILVEIKKSTATRRLSMSTRGGQTFRISAPRGTSDTAIELFIQQHHKQIIRQHLSKSDSLISSNLDLCDYSRNHFETHKQSALEFCIRKVEQWNTKLGWNYQKITVKSLKTKRGSCSSKGNLNFNYKLIFLPESMADYIILHELCHLREMNHGPKFWKLVEEVYGPEWKKWRKIR